MALPSNEYPAPRLVLAAAWRLDLGQLMGWSVAGSRDVEAVGVHHFGPGRHEIVDELRRSVALGVDFG